MSETIHGKAIRRTLAKYRMIQFVRPDGYWPHPYTIDQAFGLLGWMVESVTDGDDYDQSRWGEHCPLGLLSKKPTCVNFRSMEAITSIDDLMQRFHFALLSGHVGRRVQAWRERLGITIASEPMVRFPHYRMQKGPVSASHMKDAVNKLLGATGKLAVQLNKYHKAAREIYGVRAGYCRHRHGWHFTLRYGFDNSSWSHELALQEPGEAFWDACVRAISELAKLKGSNDDRNRRNQGAATASSMDRQGPAIHAGLRQGQQPLLR